MVVVTTSLSAMQHHNPRPRQLAETHSTASEHGEGGGQHSKQRRHVTSSSFAVIDAGPGCSSSSGSDLEGSSSPTEYQKRHQLQGRQNHHHGLPFYTFGDFDQGTNCQRKDTREPGFFYNGEEHHSGDVDEVMSKDKLNKNIYPSKAFQRGTSLEKFLSLPLSTPSPSSSPSLSPTKSAPHIVKGNSNHMNKNGLTGHHKAHVISKPSPLGHPRNGVVDSNQDYVLLAQYRDTHKQGSGEKSSGQDAAAPPRPAESPMTSPPRGDVKFLTQYSDSCLIDAGEHHARQSRDQVDSISSHPHSSSAQPTASNSTSALSQEPPQIQQRNSARKKPPKLSNAGVFFHNGKNSSFPSDSSGTRNVDSAKKPLTSMSLDSPYGSMSRLDTWSPSYVRASFFMSSGAGDPIHHPVPRRGAQDGVRRSRSSGLFVNVPSSHNEALEKNGRSNAISSSSGTVGGSSGVSSLSQHHDHNHSDHHPLPHHHLSHRPRSSSNDMFKASHMRHLRFGQQQSPLSAGNRLHSSTRDLSITRDAASLADGNYDTGSLRSVKLIHIGKQEDAASVRSLNVPPHSSSRTAPGEHRDVPTPGTDLTAQPGYGTLPRKGSHGQYLRRTVSHDPRVGEVIVKSTPVVVRTASDGEIESEYVTLDRTYVPSVSSRLCQVIEDIPTAQGSDIGSNSSTRTLSNVSFCSFPKEGEYGISFSAPKHRNNKHKTALHESDYSEHNGGDASLSSSGTSTNSDKLQSNLVKPRSILNNSMPSSSSLRHSVAAEERKNNTLKKKVSPGPLRAMAETLGSVFSTNRPSSDAGDSRRDDGLLSHSNSDNPHHHNNPTFPLSPNAMSTNYSTLQRPTTRSSKDEQPRMTRSKSLPDLQKDGLDGGNGVDNASNGGGSNADAALKTTYSDDEDGDEFGFLSYPISFSSSFSSSSFAPSAMNKAKSSPSPGARIFPKRWRTKSKGTSSSAPDPAAMWTPGPPGSCMWSSVSGRKVILRPVSILQLTESERQALQKIAHSKLQDMELGCPVVIPKDTADTRRSKKSALSLKRRSKSVSSPSLDSVGKDGASPGLVFGIPLSKCVMNDREMEKKRRRVANSTTSASDLASGVASSPPSSSKMRTDSGENYDPAQNNGRHHRKSSSSSQGSLENSSGMTPYRKDALVVPAQKRAVSSDSLSESESSRNTSSSLIDALTLSLQAPHPAFRPGSLSMDARELANQGQAQVPYVVKTCFKHIETHGLQTLGIFRVGSSKKRVKQLREEFDSGQEVQLTEDHNPHDVGALLKEYYRDLPEPLLTRDLYMPFLCAKRMKEEHQRHNALRLLICMLPLANRDTLWSLLRFLARVAQHAQDTIDEKGETIPGNKMDAHNLATLFGPNILRRSPAGGPGQATDKELMYQTGGDRVEESKEVIEVVKDMIDNHHELFELSGSLRDDVLRLLIETDQETTDRVLKYLANQNQIDADPESMSSVFEDSSANSPMLHHPSLRGGSGGNGSLDSPSVATTSHHHRPLRVSRSADNSLDSPVSKSRATHLSDSQAIPGRDSLAGAGIPHSHSLSYSPGKHSHSHHPHLEAQLTPPSSLTPSLPVTVPQFDPHQAHHHHHHHHHHHRHHHHHNQQQHQGFPNPLPELRVHPTDSSSPPRPDSTAAAIAGATGAIVNVILRGKPQTLQVRPSSTSTGLPSRPHSEGYTHPNLNIPHPVYLRENSAASSFGSSGSNDALSSSLNSHGGGSDSNSNPNRQSGHWGLLTPPTSRGSSPSSKTAFFSSASSSSTLIPSTSPLGPSGNNNSDENQPPLGSAEWERERWKHWEKVAAEKSRKNAEAEQETLV